MDACFSRSGCAGEQKPRTIIPKALASQPLRACGTSTANVADTTLVLEFMALAHHRKAIREELSRDGEAIRKSRSILCTGLSTNTVSTGGWSPPS